MQDIDTHRQAAPETSAAAAPAEPEQQSKATPAETAGQSAPPAPKLDAAMPPSPPATPAKSAGADQRNHTRYPVHWRVALRLQGVGAMIVQGRTMDVSLTGCSVVIPDNINPQQNVTLFLQLPMDYAGQPAVVIEIDAKIVHAALSGHCHGFLLGIAFRNFKGDGKERMTNRLGLSMPRVLASA